MISSPEVTTKNLLAYWFLIMIRVDGARALCMILFRKEAGHVQEGRKPRQISDRRAGRG
jgi:hypothetical protein